MRKKMMIGLMTALVMMTTTACGAGSSPSMFDAVNETAVDSFAKPESYGASNSLYEETDLMTSEDQGETSVSATNRKLIKNVDLDVETKEYDSLMAGINSQVEGLGGYIENMDSYNGSRYSGGVSSRYANLTIRIPAKKLNVFLDNISQICNVIRRNERVDDVTLRYVDMASRRDSLQVEQARLMELISQATTLEDILTIEERLSSVRYELESMESQLRTMDNQVDYSTVSLSISEVKELTPVHEETVWERISTGFVKSLEDVGTGLVNVFVWFIVALPHLLVWAIIIAIIIFVVLKIRKKNKIKKQEEIAKYNQAVMKPVIPNPNQITPPVNNQVNVENKDPKANS